MMIGGPPNGVRQVIFKKPGSPSAFTRETMNQALTGIYETALQAIRIKFAK
jgi:hypothetical protein